MERQDVERAFRDFCLDNGFSLIPPPEADGEVHRFDSIDSRGKPRRRGAWYKLYADGYRPTGIVGDHRGDQLKWVADAPAVKMSPQERAAFARVKEQKAAERERAEKAKHEAAAALARQDIDAAQPASADHPYLVTKRLAPDGWLQSGDHLIVPMRDADGTFINRQTISGDGQKRFRAGGRKKGAFSVFGPSPSPDTQRLVIAEGAATAASIAASIPESTVIAAMDCGNLTPVAETLRRLCPAAVIVVAADDDCETPGNPGLRHAEQAAKAVKGSVAIPRIEGVASACDFSDVFLVAGAERVAAAVEERFARHQNAPPWDEPGRASDDRAEPFDATTAEEILAFDEYDAGQPKGAADATPANSAWRKHMLRKMDGELRASAIENGRLVLANTPAYRDLFGFDLFRGCVTVTKRPSWEPDIGADWSRRKLSDTDLLELVVRLEYEGLAFDAQKAKAAVTLHARQPFYAYDPVTDYLNKLQWDGVPRLDRWLIDHLGAFDTPLNRAFGAKFMIGAVARAMRPGCKVDTMLVLEGGQGLLKSTALKTIASLGDDETLFSDVDVNLHSKDTLIDLQGVWIQEIAELDGLDKADITRIKAFLSRSNDRFRSPYGVETQDHPRRFVFAGTINPGASAQYLRDPTGGRRFWPVRVQKADIDALRAARDALWAEAVHRFCAGEAWWLDEEGLARDAVALQADRTEIDPLLERVALFLEDMDRSALKSAANRGPYYEEYGVVVSAYEIAELAMEIPPKDITPALGRRIASMMTALGWQAVKLKHGPRRDQRVYHKPTAAPSEPEAEQHHEPAFEDYQ